MTCREQTAADGVPISTDYRAYYEERHSGDYVMTPLAESTGFALLQWRRLGWVLDDLEPIPKTG